MQQQEGEVGDWQHLGQRGYKPFLKAEAGGLTPAAEKDGVL